MENGEKENKVRVVKKHYICCMLWMVLNNFTSFSIFFYYFHVAVNILEIIESKKIDTFRVGSAVGAQILFGLTWNSLVLLVLIYELRAKK